MMDDSIQQTQVTVLFFAKAREITGVKEIKITVPKKISAADLLEIIILTYQLESIKDILILAVNEEFVASDTELELSEKDEIAIIPPLSGEPMNINMEESKNIVKLQQKKLEIDEIVNNVVSPSCGAISTFIGTTRENFESKKVVKLEYEAYEPMALKEMNNICEKIRAKWNVKHVAIYHRLGDVPVCEASVAIAISSTHRQESLEAVQYAIDTLKSTVPIWKKEIYDTAESTWKENKECYTKIIPKLEVSDVVDDDDDDELKYKIKQHDQQNVGKIEIDFDQVQVRADAAELDRRIKSFIARKRQQVNTLNIQEFCNHSNVNIESESSCARVDAILIRRKDSKSHVKVHRVFNPHGPQTMNFTSFVDNSRIHSNQHSVESSDHPLLDERLSVPEKFLNINKPVPRDIYERIKNIEDRILYLEGISPEYKEFYMLRNSEDVIDSHKQIRKRTFSTAELDTKLYELENKYVKKMK